MCHELPVFQFGGDALVVEAATKGFGAPSDAFAPNFAMRRRFAAGTFARAILALPVAYIFLFNLKIVQMIVRCPELRGPEGTSFAGRRAAMSSDTLLRSPRSAVS